MIDEPRSPAETLRAAAARVREVAQAALDDVGHGDGHAIIDTEGRMVLSSDALVAIRPAPAAHIALFHPGVALAVADWLDDSAARLETNEVARALEYAPKDYVAALAVARLLLPDLTNVFEEET